MVEILTTVVVAFSAGSAGGWLLRSALARYSRPLRDFEASPEGVEIRVTEPIDQVRRSLRTTELLPPQTDMGMGPLVPESRGARVTSMPATCGGKSACCGKLPYKPVEER
jgi:hypothetical protein